MPAQELRVDSVLGLRTLWAWGMSHVTSLELINLPHLERASFDKDDGPRVDTSGQPIPRDHDLDELRQLSDLRRLSLVGRRPLSRLPVSISALTALTHLEASMRWGREAQDAYYQKRDPLTPKVVTSGLST